MSNQQTETKSPSMVSVVTRLNQEVYEQLERKHVTFKPNSTSTELEAGYALGVQAVLKDLRAGYVTTRS